MSLYCSYQKHEKRKGNTVTVYTSELNFTYSTKTTCTVLICLYCRTATVQNGSLNQANHTVENNVDDVSMETETLNNEEDEENLIESANKRRKSSYVLTVIPGRRSSATVQFVKVPRKREERKLSEEEEEEEDNNDIINDETVIISDNEIVQSKGKANWIKRKLASLKKGILIALKNIKCFAK